MQGIIADSHTDLKCISQRLDLVEAFLLVGLSFFNRLCLGFHQVERVAALPADGGLQCGNRIFKEWVADISNTRRIVVVLVIVGKCTPLRPGVDNLVANLSCKLDCAQGLQLRGNRDAPQDHTTRRPCRHY